MTHSLPVRRHCVSVKVGHISIGGQAPVVVQSMTNTDTADIVRTTAQIAELADAGSEIVRITVNNEESAAAVAHIYERLQSMGVDVPIVGDFHFNGHKLLSQHPACAQALAKLRINPGNVGRGDKRDAQFAQMIELACQYDKPVRIGVNWGSLDQELLTRMIDDNAVASNPQPMEVLMREALIESALRSANRAQELGLAHDKIILSCKLSGVQPLIDVYTDLAKRCDYPLHLGLTEAGMGVKGIVSSTAALAVLLQQGIGDTIRVSLTPEPGASRTQEVVVAQEILQSLGLRTFLPSVIACPGCGRTSSDIFQRLAQNIQEYIRKRMPQWRTTYPGVENMSVAVMGCVVNGPGESKHASIGISLPGAGETPMAPVYENGERTTTLQGDTMAEEFQQLVEAYVKRHYGKQA